MTTPFQTRQPHVDGNHLLRTPQREAYNALSEYAAAAPDDERAASHAHAVLHLEKGLLSKSGGVYEVPAAHH